jgi:integrase
MYSKIRLKEHSVVVYYSGQNSTVRYKTGVTITSPKDWNRKKQQLAPSVPNYTEKMKVVNLWKERADTIINEALADGVKISGVELQRGLDRYKAGLVLPKTTKLTELYEQFYQEKKSDLLDNPKKSESSLKDYTSFGRTLSDYTKQSQYEWVINELGKDWCKKFEKWLSQERPTNAEYLTRGRLSPKTIKKRFDTLKSLMRWVEEREIMVHIKPVTNYRISVPDTIIDTLTKEEVQEFYNTEFKNDRLNKVRDLFVFVCHTGLRWEDLRRVRKVHMKEYDEGTILSKVTYKSRNTTHEKFSVPLSKTAMQIFQRYDYDLELISHQKANQYIKEAMMKSGQFDDEMEKMDKDGRYLKRWQYFSFHDGRRSFITNLINSAIPVNEIMKYTGHKKISTLQQYIDKTRPTSFDFIKILDCHESQ